MKRLVRHVANALRVPDLDTPRYFIVSPYKTATTTVGQALITLGAGTHEMTFRRDGLGKSRPALFRLARDIPDDADARTWIVDNIDVARQTMDPIMHKLLRFDVFSDAPFGHGNVHCFILKAVLPNARFIWVDRPLYDWLDSVRAWELSHPETYRDTQEWVENPSYRRRRLRRKRDRLYDDFNRLAQDYPEDCLELGLEDLQSWDKLAAFCDLPAPEGAPAAQNVQRPKDDLDPNKGV